MLTAIARGMAVRMRRAKILSQATAQKGHTQNIFPIRVDHNRRRSLSVSALALPNADRRRVLPRACSWERARRNCEGWIHHNPMIYRPHRNCH